jgi:small GTP-binding protein
MSDSSKKTCDREAKVVLVGESGVGKSSLTLRFVTGSYSENTPSTIGASFMSKIVTVPGDQASDIKMNIWDTAGQEKYRSLAALYYRGAVCAIVVYDITNRTSFEEARAYWIDELKRECGSKLVLVVVGNKSDRSVSERTVETEEGLEFAESHQAAFFETSAEKDINITDLFTYLASHLPSLETKEDDAEAYVLQTNAEPQLGNSVCFCSL